METLTREEQKIVHDAIERAFANRRGNDWMRKRIWYRQMSPCEFGEALVETIKATKKLNGPTPGEAVERMIHYGA